MAQGYSANDLTSLKGLEPVRARPGMYIGSTDVTGLHHLIWELIDNAVDEANAGYGKNIYVTLNIDGSVTVQDEGRGVPCDYNEKEKKFDTILKEDINGNTSQGVRGIYIEDTLYVISGNIIEAYDMNTGEKTGDIIL